MVDPREFFEAGLTLHGHKCPAMPLGLRAGAMAMNTLGVERSRGGDVMGEPYGRIVGTHPVRIPCAEELRAEALRAKRSQVRKVAA